MYAVAVSLGCLLGQVAAPSDAPSFVPQVESGVQVEFQPQAETQPELAPQTEATGEVEFAPEAEAGSRIQFTPRAQWTAPAEAENAAAAEAADEPLAPEAAKTDWDSAPRPIKSVLKTSGVETVGATAPAEPPLAPVRTSLERGFAPQMLTEALTPPQEGAIPGRPVTLLESISRNIDRSQQLWITRAYWKLQVSLGDYHLALEELQRMEQTPGDSRPADAAILQTAKAGAAARVHETEIAALTAQHELAELLRLAPGEPLPLPSDLPHVGQYRTHFETLFSGRTPPPRARLIDRTLPLRRELLEVRASAVQSAAAALQAVEDAYVRKSTDMRSVIAAHETLWRERRNFLVAVRDYNHDIAEYAMTVAEIGTTEVTLVSMLIKSSTTRPSSSIRTEPTPAVRPDIAPRASVEPGKLPASAGSSERSVAPAPVRADPFDTEAGPSRSIMVAPGSDAPSAAPASPATGPIRSRPPAAGGPTRADFDAP